MENENKLKKRKTLFIRLAASVITVFLCFYLYWIFVSNSIYTDNAYAAADLAQITSPVPGIVNKVLVSNTDIVKEGDVLVILDQTDLKINLQQAEFDLVTAEFNLLKAKKDYERRKYLKSDAVSREEVNHAESGYGVAESAVLNAKAKLEQAKINLERSIIKAPISGVIAQKSVMIGQNLQKGDDILSIVPIDEIYVNANYKEVQLRNIKIGDEAIITSDYYGDKVIYKGRVVGISGGTGAAFAIIPAQNATGNWIKVVQRLPVKIALDPKELQKHPLRVGLSMESTIKIKGN